MKTTLGFLSIKSYWDVSPGKTAPFGELGVTSATYEQNVQEVFNPNQSDQVLYVFKHQNDAVDTAISTEIKNVIWEVLDWTMTQVQNGTVTSNKDDFHILINAHFDTKLYQFKVGDTVRHQDEYAPSYLEWVDANGNTYTIWLAEEVFNKAYPEGSLKVVPLINKTEFWFSNKNAVMTEIEKFTPEANINHLNQLQLREDGTFATFTTISTITIRWYEKNNSDNYVDTKWYVGVYGVAKNNPEDLKIAIRDYLLANSTYEEYEWLSVFPEIFNPVEFTLVPMWKHLASSPSVETAIYQPILRLKQAFSLYNEIAVDYGEDHINEHLEAIPNLNGSLTLLGVGSPKNDLGKYRLSTLYPSYFLVSDKSLDWSRLKPKAKDFVTALHTIVQLAKFAGPSNTLPAGYHRVYRHGNMFLVTKVGEITMMVLSRMSYEEKYPNINDDVIEV